MLLCNRASQREARVVDDSSLPVPPLSDKLAVKLGVVGISFRSSAFERSLGMRLTEESRAEVLDRVQERLGFDELVYVGTCNRIELVYSSEEPLAGASDPRSGELLRLFGCGEEEFGPEDLHYYAGREAVRYVFRMAASLDSMVLGEAQILGQMKRAFQVARVEKRVGPRVSSLFDAAARLARKVRRETGLGAGRVSMVSLVAQQVREHLRWVAEPVVALLGAGEIIIKVAALLKEEGRGRLLFVNRTLERAEDLARIYGGVARDLRSFLDAPPKLDLLVTGTSAPTALVGKREVASMLPVDKDVTELLIIDLAVPADVERNVADLRGVELVGVEDLRRRADETRDSRQAELGKALELLDKALLEIRKVEREEQLARTAGALSAGLERYVSRPGLSEKGESWSGLLVRRAHKVLMTELRGMLGGCDCFRPCDRLDQAVEAIGTGAVGICRRGDFICALATPKKLHRKAYRSLSDLEKAELDSWFERQVPKVGELMDRVVGEFETLCPCQ